MAELHGTGTSFPQTRHSIVEATRGADAETRERAYGALVATYWRPVYKYLRVKWSLDVDDASDLTQEFFARAFEKNYFAAYDPTLARFRTFLRTCLDRFVSNERKAAGRFKRGGQTSVVALEFADAEDELRTLALADSATAEDYFHREWVRSLFGLAVADLRARLEASGRGIYFEIFARYDLDEGAGDRPTYTQLAEELGIVVTSVTNHLAAARREFRAIVLARLRETCGSEAEFRSEARALLGVDLS